MLYLKVRKPS